MRETELGYRAPRSSEVTTGRGPALPLAVFLTILPLLARTPSLADGPEEQKPERTAATPPTVTWPAPAVALPDRPPIGSGSLDQVTLTRIATLPAREGDGPVRALRFFPNGDVLIAGGGTDSRDAGDYPLHLWAWPEEKRLGTLHGHEGQVRGLRFSRQGDLLASVGMDAMLLFWSARDLSRSAEKRHRGKLSSVDFSPSSGLVAVGGYDKVSVYDRGTGEFDGEWESDCQTLAFTPSGAIVTATANHAEILVFEPGVPDPVRRLPARAGQALAVTLRGDRAASAGRGEPIRMWDLDTGREIRSFEEGEDSTTCLDFSPDGKVLSAAGLDGKLRLWECDTGRLVCIADGPRARINAIAFSPDGRWLASGGDDGEIRVWARTD